MATPICAGPAYQWERRRRQRGEAFAEGLSQESALGDLLTFWA
jgi:hypothetical protein